MSVTCHLCHTTQSLEDTVYHTAGSKYQCMNNNTCKEKRTPLAKESTKTNDIFTSFGIYKTDLVLHGNQYRDGVTRYVHPPTGNRYNCRHGFWTRIYGNTSYDDLTLINDPHAL